MGDIMAHVKQEKLTFADLKLTPGALAELLALVADGTISGKVCALPRAPPRAQHAAPSARAPPWQIGKDLLKPLLKDGGSPRRLIETQNLVQISDTAVLEAIIAQVLASNEKQVAEFRGGKDKLKGFFVGQVMKQSGGKANPAMIEQLLMQRLLRADAA